MPDEVLKSRCNWPAKVLQSRAELATLKPGPMRRIYCFEGFTLDLHRGCLVSADGERALRPKSFEVLCHLVENAGRLVSKDELVSAIWPRVIVNDDSLARCISEVRLAIGDRQQRIIKTVPRRGYRFAVPVEGHSEAEPTEPASPTSPGATDQLSTTDRPFAPIDDRSRPGAVPAASGEPNSASKESPTL
jgi:DNA-binding winged helix-turn-helix (wHTH) protein